MLNTILYSWKDGPNNEVKKGQGNTSSVSASATPTRSTVNNNVSTAIANNDALFDRKIDHF